MDRHSRSANRQPRSRSTYRLHRDLLSSGLCFALGLGLVTAPKAASATAQSSFAAHPYAPLVAEASQRFGIPEGWIWAVMRAESRGNSRAVSPAGAMGLMQIMPGTWAMLTQRHRLGSDPFDIRANILGGTAYLRAMWDRYGDISLMLAAYNAGPRRADDYARGRRRLPAETMSYVARISASLGHATASAPAAARAPALLSWRQAALFAARENDSAEVMADATVSQTERAINAPSAASPQPDAHSAHRLFVPLSPRNP
jgi:soluble lytic murein transglycosylase-like protein